MSLSHAERSESYPIEKSYSKRSFQVETNALSNILFKNDTQFLLFIIISGNVALNSEVKPVRLDDDTERYGRLRIKTLNYASYTQLVRMVKILRCRRPEALA